MSASNDCFLLILFLASIILSALPGCSDKDSSPERPGRVHGRFSNVYPSNSPGFVDFLKWRWQRRGSKVPPPESHNFPLVRNDPEFLKSNRTKISLTWIGHATVLLQLNGKNILTDPHFSERASPVQWAGPKRVMPPGLSFDELPQIDMVVISHDHYDSLDTQTIIRLRGRERGENTTFVVGLGLGRWFKSLGVERVIELDWWNRRIQDGLEVIAVPVHHWSQRTPFSWNTTLWAGWVIRSEGFSFFFSGDSGYSPIFKDIGRRVGPFDLSAIPIGAYEPRWFMRYHHVSPEEAVQIHLDIGSKKSVAIHWGTFMLTDEPLDEPPKKLRNAIKEKGLTQDDFLALRHGETIVLDADNSWRSLDSKKNTRATR